MTKFNDEFIQRFKTGEIAIEYTKVKDLNLLNAFFVAAGYKGNANGTAPFYISYKEGKDWTGKGCDRDLRGAKLYTIKEFLLKNQSSNYEIY